MFLDMGSSYLLARERGRGLPADLSHAPLADFDLFLGIKDRRLGVRRKIFTTSGHWYFSELMKDEHIPGMMRYPRRAMGIVIIPSMMKSPTQFEHL